MCSSDLEEGHAIALIGMFEPALEGSELEKLRGRLGRSLPPLDLAAHTDALVRVRAAIRGNELPTAHDVSEGGLACALAECAILGGIGAKVSLELSGGLEGAPVDHVLFGEGPGGILLAGPRDELARLEESLHPHGFLMIGETGGDRVDITAGVATLCVPVADAQEAYERSLPRRFE